MNLKSLLRKFLRNWKRIFINGFVSILVGIAPFVFFEQNIVAVIPKPLFAAILFMAMIALFYILSMRRGLKEIQYSIKLFQEGNFEQRLSVRNTPQLSGIALSFNAMADRIVENIEALKEYERLRTELLTNVSHDLRSPLTSIQGYVDTVLLKGDALSSKQRKEYLEIVGRNTTSLIQLIDELFELSKLEERGTLTNFEPFSLMVLAENLALRFYPIADAKGITFSVSLPETLPNVLGEEKLVERAIGNIIQNAIYYTPNNGKVEFKISLEENLVIVSVQDTGIGIPEDALPHVVERFYRVNKDRSRKTGGSGLGLAITKRIVEAHQSELIIKSKLGEGTNVTFCLYRFNE